MSLIVACVRTGALYPFEYVIKLRNMVERHLSRPFSLICLTDQPDRCDGVNFIDIAEVGLTGWWAKMLLFAPEWRQRSTVCYFDLDTVLIGDVAPLADVPGEFSILESPVRREGLPYPCRFNSSVMTIGGGQASFIWTRFEERRDEIIAACGPYGDQLAIERLCPSAQLLQPLLPGFFCNYRHLTMHQPKAAAVINFGGSHRPHTCSIPWVQAAWR